MATNGLNYASSGLTFTTNAVKREIIDNSGNHGFGTLSPSTLVHISGSSTPVRIEGLASGTDGRILASNNNGVLSYRDDVLVAGSIANNTITLTDSDGTTTTLTPQAVTAVTYNNAWDIALAGSGTIGTSPIDLPFVTGGTYNAGNSTLTLGINGGLESDITITGLDGADTYATGMTLSNGDLTITRNDGNSFNLDAFRWYFGADSGSAGTINLDSGIDIFGGTGIETSSNGTDTLTISLITDSFDLGSTTIALGDTVTTVAGLTSVTSLDFVGDLTGNVTGDVTGNADTATALETGRAFSITGDITANSITFDGTGDVAFNATIDAGVVGTAELADNAVTTAKIGDGEVTNAKLENSTLTFNAPVGSDPAISLGETLNLISSDSSVVISGNSTTLDLTVGAGVDTYSTGATFSNGLLTIGLNDGTDFGVTGFWTAIPNNALDNDTVTIGTTNIVLGGSSDTLAGLTSVTSTTFVGDLNGNADSASVADSWSSQMVLTLGTDLSGSVSFDGSTNVTLNASLGSGVVDTAELADGAVTTVKIADANVTTAKIADGNVTNGKLENSIISFTDGNNSTDVALGEGVALEGTTNKISVTNVTGTFTFDIGSDVVTLDGSQTLTNKTINGSQLVNGSVTNAKLENSAITLIGDSGVNQTISLGDSMTFSGSSGIEFVGVTTDEMHVVLDNSVLQFKSEKGQANGYAELDANGKVPASQLPATAFEYKGAWNAATNTPTLADGTGDAGDTYRVATGGTQNLGGGNVTYSVGDLVIYDGAEWQRVDGADAVESVNGQTGVVVLTTDNINEGSTNLYDKTVVLTSGTGISATGTYPNFTITNSDRGSSQNIFKTIDTPLGTDPVASDNNDTLVFISSDDSVSISGNSSSNTIDIKVDTSTVTNFYTSDGQLTGVRTVTQNNNALNFVGGDFTVDGTTFSVDDSKNAVGIGVAAPADSAVLEVASTSKGFLFPRMTEAQRGNISSPATGLLVYQTDGDEGVYIKKSFGWVQVI